MTGPYSIFASPGLQQIKIELKGDIDDDDNDDSNIYIFQRQQ